jgi:hypothetical protein
MQGTMDKATAFLIALKQLTVIRRELTNTISGSGGGVGHRPHAGHRPVGPPWRSYGQCWWQAPRLGGLIGHKRHVQDRDHGRGFKTIDPVQLQLV